MSVGELRPATAADLRVVASWIDSAAACELWAGWRVTFPIALDTLARDIGLDESNGFALIEAVGLVGFGQLVAKPAGRGHLGRLIVDPRRRGQGLGAKLAQGLIAAARARGVTRCSLNVSPHNTAAAALYAKLGFTDAALPQDEPPAANSRYMERPL